MDARYKNPDNDPRGLWPLVIYICKKNDFQVGDKIEKYGHEAYVKAYKKLFVSSNPNIETREVFFF
jgi:hypothetical protein